MIGVAGWMLIGITTHPSSNILQPIFSHKYSHLLQNKPKHTTWRPNRRRLFCIYPMGMLTFHSNTPKTGHKGMRVLGHNGSQRNASNRPASNIVVVDERMTNYSPMSWKHVVESGMYFTRRMFQPRHKIRCVDLWPGCMCIAMSTTDDRGMSISATWLHLLVTTIEYHMTYLSWFRHIPFIMCCIIFQLMYISICYFKTHEFRLQIKVCFAQESSYHIHWNILIMVQWGKSHY